MTVVERSVLLGICFCTLVLNASLASAEDRIAQRINEIVGEEGEELNTPKDSPNNDVSKRSESDKSPLMELANQRPVKIRSDGVKIYLLKDGTKEYITGKGEVVKVQKDGKETYQPHLRGPIQVYTRKGPAADSGDKSSNNQDGTLPLPQSSTPRKEEVRSGADNIGASRNSEFGLRRSHKSSTSEPMESLRGHLGFEDWSEQDILVREHAGGEGGLLDSTSRKPDKNSASNKSIVLQDGTQVLYAETGKTPSITDPNGQKTTVNVVTQNGVAYTQWIGPQGGSYILRDENVWQYDESGSLRSRFNADNGVSTVITPSGEEYYNPWGGMIGAIKRDSQGNTVEVDGRGKVKFYGPLGLLQATGEKDEKGVYQFREPDGRLLDRPPFAFSNPSELQFAPFLKVAMSPASVSGSITTAPNNDFSRVEAIQILPRTGDDSGLANMMWRIGPSVRERLRNPSELEAMSNAIDRLEKNTDPRIRETGREQREQFKFQTQMINTLIRLNLKGGSRLEDATLDTIASDFSQFQQIEQERAAVSQNLKSQEKELKTITVTIDEDAPRLRRVGKLTRDELRSVRKDLSQLDSDALDVSIKDLQSTLKRDRDRLARLSGKNESEQDEIRTLRETTQKERELLESIWDRAERKVDYSKFDKCEQGHSFEKCKHAALKKEWLMDKMRDSLGEKFFERYEKVERDEADVKTKTEESKKKIREESALKSKIQKLEVELEEKNAKKSKIDELNKHKEDLERTLDESEKKITEGKDKLKAANEKIQALQEQDSTLEKQSQALRDKITKAGGSQLFN